MSNGELRIVIGEGAGVRAWEVEAVRMLMAVPGVRILGSWNAAPAIAEARRASWSERRFRKLERSISRNELLDHSQGGMRTLGIAAIRAFADTPCDLVLLLGGTDSSAGHPCAWSFRHADGAGPDSALPMLREWVHGMPHGRFQLIDAGTQETIRELCLPVTGDATECVERAVRTAMRWPADAARAWIATGARPQSAMPVSCKPIPMPGFLDLLRARFGGQRRAAQASSRWRDGDWNIGVLHQPMHALLDAAGSRNVRWLPNPSKGMSRMEPFGYLDAEGDFNVLYRKCSASGNDARIARLRPKPDNILKRSRSMIDSVADASYPFTLHLNSAMHAVISDLEHERVLLMKVSADNDALADPMVLVDVALHAPTLLEHEGRWWLLGSSDPEPDAMLRAFHSERAEGPYVEHACSPMKCDARHARPAGTPFVHEGQLYRPALDCTKANGPAVWINRVDRLDPVCFHETPLRSIDGFVATAYGRGVRTISSMGEVTLVDGLRSPVIAGKRANAQRGRSKRRRRSPSDDDDDT